MDTSLRIKDSFFGSLFHFLGKRTIEIVNGLGAVAIFFAHAFLKIFRPKQIREIVQQVYYIGAKSSDIVMLIGLFTGMVLGLQLYYALSKVGSEGFLASLVRCTFTHQGIVGVLTAIIITARQARQ